MENLKQFFKIYYVSPSKIWQSIYVYMYMYEGDFPACMVLLKCPMVWDIVLKLCDDGAAKANSKTLNKMLCNDPF